MYTTDIGRRTAVAVQLGDKLEKLLLLGSPFLGTESVASRKPSAARGDVRQ